MIVMPGKLRMLGFGDQDGSYTLTESNESIHPGRLNIEPENDGLEDDVPFPGMYSQVPYSFSRVYKTCSLVLVQKAIEIMASSEKQTVGKKTPLCKELELYFAILMFVEREMYIIYMYIVTVYDRKRCMYTKQNYTYIYIFI